MISIQWLSQCFDKAKYCLNGTEKGLGLSVARILTLYNIWSQNKQTYQGWKAEMLVVWLPYLFE